MTASVSPLTQPARPQASSGRVLVIANPAAAGHVRRPQLAATYAELGGVDVVTTRSLDELDAVARSVVASPPALLAISGGDGTLSLTLTALAAAAGGMPDWPILPLRAGSMNMIHRSVGVPADPVVALRQAARGTMAAPRTTMHVEGRYGFIFGFGLVTNFLKLYYDGPGRGPVKAAKTVARAVAAVATGSPLRERLFRRVDGELSADGGRVHREAAFSAVLMQTIENLGIGFRPCYRAFEDPARAHLLATDLSAPGIVGRLSYIFRGRPWATPRTSDEVVADLTFRASSPFTYTLDGELYDCNGELRVDVGPPVHFVRPVA